MDKERSTERIRVVIYGVHSEDWMTALSPAAEIWKQVAGVEEVLLLSEGQTQGMPTQQDPTIKTVLIPLMERHAINCPSGYFTLMPSAQMLLTLGLKHNFADYMQRIGLISFCPKHYKKTEDIRYPCVLKRVNLCAGIGVALIRSIDELNLRAHESQWQKQLVVIQEAVLEGVEFVTHLVVKRGKILWHATFLYKLRKNETIRTPSNVVEIQRSLADKHVLHIFEKCLGRLDYSGPCNIDYKLLDNGLLKILEINPRLGGSLMRKDSADLLAAALSCILKHAERPVGTP